VKIIEDYLDLIDLSVYTDSEMKRMVADLSACATLTLCRKSFSCPKCSVYRSKKLKLFSGKTETMFNAEDAKNKLSSFLVAVRFTALHEKSCELGSDESFNIRALAPSSLAKKMINEIERRKTTNEVRTGKKTRKSNQKADKRPSVQGCRRADSVR